MNKFILSIAVLFLTQLGIAQSPHIDGEITGKIVDAQSEEAIEFATISVISVLDSTVVTGNISGMSGEFVVDDVPVGEYYVVLSYIGYEEITLGPIKISGANKKEHLGTIKISSHSLEIGEVIVRERKDAIETRLDKRVFNASQDIASQSGDALEMMRNVPSIDVDVEGNISLRGNENVKILIDGRPTSFSPSDLLRQTPASNIERVEIITNPGAKYDPEGTAGIINIVMKRSDKVGFNGNVNMGVTYAHYMQYNGGVGLNMRNKRMNAFINYGFSDAKRRRSGHQDRFIKESQEYSIISQDSDGYWNRGGHNIEGGMDIYVNNSNTFYWTGTFRTHGNPSERIVDYSYKDADGNPLYRERRTSDQTHGGENYRINLGWMKKFSEPEHQLDIDFVYDLGDRGHDQEYFNQAYADDGSLFPIYDREKQGEKRNDSEIMSKIDYTRPFGEGMSLEAGLHHNLRLKYTDTWFSIYDDTGNYVDDPSRSNIFDYSENVMAAYLSWGHEIGSFGYKAGLRHETTILKSALENDPENKYDQTYSRLYPSIHLMQNIGATNTLLLSYSRRIERPNSWQLNPFTNYSDPLNLRSGNPYLQPEDIHSIELGYKKIWELLTLNLTGYYKIINNQIHRYVESTGEITMSTFENFGKSEEIGAETIISIRPFSWWNLTGTVNAYQSTLNNFGGLNVANTKSFRMRSQFNSQMTLPGDFMLQLSGNYSLPFKSPQGSIRSFRSINIALAKSFLDEKLRVSVNARDIFNTMQFEGDIYINDLVSEYVVHKWDSRGFGVSVSYNFGKDNSKKKQPADMRRMQMGEGGMEDGFK